MSRSPQLRPEFASALRAELIAHVSSTVRRPWWRRRGTVFGGATVTLALVVGAGAAVASGLLPGARETVALGTAVSADADGDGVITLGDAPDNATNVSVALTCESTGVFFFPDGSSLACSSAEVGSTVNVLLPLASQVTITADGSASWKAHAAFVNSATTPWAKNERGQTYGAINDTGEPDLVAVITTEGKQGFAYATELAEASGGQDFASPEEALTWQAEHDGAIVAVPVYRPDGETKVGEFVIRR